MAQIRDITILENDLIAITFEDENGRDLRFIYGNRADENTIDALKTWTPGANDVTVTIQLDQDLADLLRQWCKERNIELENFIRAFFIFTVETRDTDILMHILLGLDPDNPDLAAMRKANRIAQEHGNTDMTLDEINAEIAAARAEMARKAKIEETKDFEEPDAALRERLLTLVQKYTSAVEEIDRVVMDNLHYIDTFMLEHLRDRFRDSLDAEQPASAGQRLYAEIGAALRPHQSVEKVQQKLGFFVYKR